MKTLEKVVVGYWIIIISVSAMLFINTYKNNQIFNSIPKIDNYNALQAAYKENIGECLIQGQLVAINPIEGKYSYIKRSHQNYQTYYHTYTDNDGDTHTEVSHDWETYKTDYYYANGWQFYDIILPITELPWVCHIRTEKNGANHRIVYEGCNYIYNCTVYGNIQNNYINNPVYYFDKSIDNVITLKTTYAIPFVFSTIGIVIGIFMIKFILKEE